MRSRITNLKHYVISTLTVMIAVGIMASCTKSSGTTGAPGSGATESDPTTTSQAPAGTSSARLGTAAAPTASVADGGCGEPQTVTLSSSTSGATVHFTSGDGSQAAPTCASSTGTISLTASTTIKAIACKTNYTDSAVSTFSYSVETQSGQYCGGDGTVGSPYRICSLQTLANIANNLSASFIITKDIAASSTATSNSGAGWAPIGTIAAPFTGTLDGQNNSICGLRINNPSTDYIGLFGVASATSTIKNITFTDAGIVGKNFVGTAAGQSSGVVQNVAVQGSVQGIDHVGGILGNLTSAAGSMVDSNANSIAVSGTRHIGGVAGEVGGSATITTSWSSGTVTGDATTGSKVGGIVGRLSASTISESYSSATVSANNEVGGIAGKVYAMSGTCSIVSSYASGNVTAVGANGTNDGFELGAGGLVGVSGNCLQIQKSYATGNVINEHTSGSVGIGGLVGIVRWGGVGISDSYATGNVTSAFGSAGGLLGGGAIPISRSYATGAVTTPEGSLAGGLAAGSGSAVTNSFSTGVVSGTATTNHGGLIGTKSSTLPNSYWLAPAGSPFTCVGSSVGDAGCTNVSDVSFFSTAGGTLYSTWDFTVGTGVWYLPGSGALPVLQ